MKQTTLKLFMIIYYNITCCIAASYIIVILDNSLVFRVTIPDAVLTL